MSTPIVVKATQHDMGAKDIDIPRATYQAAETCARNLRQCGYAEVWIYAPERRKPYTVG